MNSLASLQSWNVKNLQYPNIFSSSKHLSLFQLLLSPILCASAANSAALGLCVTQAAAVNSQLFNTALFHAGFGATTQGLRPHCTLLPTRVGSGGRPSMCYRLNPLPLSFSLSPLVYPARSSRAHIVDPGCWGQQGTAALRTGFQPSSRWKTSSHSLPPPDSCRRPTVRHVGGDACSVRLSMVKVSGHTSVSSMDSSVCLDRYTAKWCTRRDKHFQMNILHRVTQLSHISYEALDPDRGEAAAWIGRGSRSDADIQQKHRCQMSGNSKLSSP